MAKDKIKRWIEGIYGKQVKHRWLKIVASVIMLLMTLGIMVFMSTNLGYSKGKFFIKPWNVDVNINKEVK